MNTTLSEKEKNNRAELFRLMQEHPDLPIIPIVDSRVVADECGYWMGSLGRTRIDEYIITEGHKRGEVFINGDTNVLDVVERYISDEDFEALTVEACRSYYDNLPWKKAIIVYIDLPKEIGKR